MRTKARKQTKRSASNSTTTSTPFFTKKGSKKPVAAQHPFFKPTIQPKLAANKKKKAIANQAAVRVGPPNGAVSWLWNEPYPLNGKYYLYKRYQNVSAKTAKEYNEYNNKNGGLGGAITKRTFELMDKEGNSYTTGHEVKNPNTISGLLNFSQKDDFGTFRRSVPLPSRLENVSIELDYNHSNLEDNTTISMGSISASSGQVTGTGTLRIPNSPAAGRLVLTVIPMDPNPNAPSNIDPSRDSRWSVSITYTDNDSPVYTSTTPFKSTLPNSLPGEPLGGTKVK